VTSVAARARLLVGLKKQREIGKNRPGAARGGHNTGTQDSRTGKMSTGKELNAMTSQGTLRELLGRALRGSVAMESSKVQG
jgi:hypothetical protein